MKIYIDKWRSQNLRNIIVVVNVRYDFGPFNLLDQLQTLFHDKKKHSKETGFIKTNEFIITHAV